MLLNKDQILTADDIKHQDVNVPEWGGTVRIAVMSAKARDAYEASTIKVVGKRIEPDMVNARAKLVAACAITEDGKQMFTPAEIEKLGAKSSTAIERLADVASRLNGLSNEAIEDTVKN